MAQVISPRPTNKKSPQPRATTAAPAAAAPRYLSLTLILGVGGALLLWAAFPPFNLPWLAWIAPLPWLWLARMPELPGKRPYVVLWAAGFLHWLCMLYGVRMAHPALNAGWIALAAYLGVYLPLFVGLTRVAVQRLRISLVVAAPIVWVGLELLRGHLITGFSLSLLAHTQAEFPLLIQISDLAGGYTLSFVIMLVAACLTRMIPPRSVGFQPASLWPLIPAAAAFVATLAYGHWRLNQPLLNANRPTAKVALIQGSLDTVFVVTDERRRETLEQYGALTRQAAAQQRNLDLVIWPESMFVLNEFLVEEPLAVPAEFEGPPEEFRERIAALQSDFEVVLANLAAKANGNADPNIQGTQLLVGTSTMVVGPGPRRVYNSALLADRRGKVVGRYYKTHAVMFGEYIPFGDVLPWIYQLTPMGGGMSIGKGPVVFDVAGLRLSPSICFESTVPHLIRGQVIELERRGTPADVLVNVTNDGWFWGSSILDLHLRCGVFRAVENRKPLIIAANTGISASIDGNGVILDRGKKREPRTIITEVQADGRTSPYHHLGDWPANLCALACLGLALVGSRRRPAGPP